MPNITEIELAEETLLATAQATLQIAMDKSKLSKAEIAKRAGEFNITYVLRGGHDLKVKTMARIAHACGMEIEFKLKKKGKS